jgi:hypothetical protein
MVQPSVALNPALDPTRDGIIFFLFAAVSAILFGSAAARSRSEVTGFLTTCVLCLALFYENLALAVWAVAPGFVVPLGMLKLRCATQSFVIPLFLVTQFELNYEVHKRRSANFFGVGLGRSMGEFEFYCVISIPSCVQGVFNSTRATAPQRATSEISCATACGFLQLFSCSFSSSSMRAT